MHFIHFKGMNFIDLPNTFRDKSVQSAVPNYFKSCEVPIICNKYNKPIRSAIIFNFNKVVVSDLDIKTCTPDSWNCNDSKYVNPAADHVITGNLKIILVHGFARSQRRVLNIGFLRKLEFQKCREKNAASLNEYCNRWCKREHVVSDALKVWKLNIFRIIDRRISFYSQNTNMLPFRTSVK